MFANIFVFISTEQWPFKREWFLFLLIQCNEHREKTKEHSKQRRCLCFYVKLSFITGFLQKRHRCIKQAFGWGETASQICYRLTWQTSLLDRVPIHLDRGRFQLLHQYQPEIITFITNNKTSQFQSGSVLCGHVKESEYLKIKFCPSGNHG